MSEPTNNELTSYDDLIPVKASSKENYSDKPLSKVARVFNRLVKEENYKTDHTGDRGRLAAENTSEVSFVDITASSGLVIRLREADGTELDITRLIVPRSSDVVKTIDDKFNQFKSAVENGTMDVQTAIRIGVLLCGIYGVCHPFYDANGRTAVAILGYTIAEGTKNLDQKLKLDFEKFQANPLHSQHMVLFGLSLSPYPYDIDSLFSSYSGEDTHFDAMEALSSQLLKEWYIRKYLLNIQRLIDSINWETGEIALSDKEFPGKSWFDVAVKELSELTEQSLENVTASF